MKNRWSVLLAVVATALLVLAQGSAGARTPFGGGFAPVGVAPTLSTLSGQDLSGGPITITGSNFSSQIAFWCDRGAKQSDGTPVSSDPMGFLPLPYITSTLLVASVPATTDAAFYSCILNNAGGGYTTILRGLEIDSTSDPSSIYGSALRAWYRTTDVSCSGACTDGSLATQFTDKTGNGYHMTATSTARPTYRTVSPGTCSGVPCFGSQPVLVFNGSSNFMATGTGAFDAASTTHLALHLIYRETSYSGSSYFAEAQINAKNTAIIPSASSSPNQPRMLSGNSASNITPGITVALGSPLQAWINVNWNSTDDAATNNSSPPTTATGATTVSVSTGTLSVGAQVNGTNPSSVEVVEMFVTNEAYNSAHEASAAKYASLRYALPGPVVTEASTLGVSGSGSTTSFAIHAPNGGLLPGSTITVAGGLASAVSSTYRTTNRIDATLTSAPTSLGKYDVQVDGPDGTVVNTKALLSVTSGSDPFWCAGSKLLAWFDPNDTSYLTCVTAGCPDGTQLTKIGNKAWLVDYTQSAGSAAPILHVNDSNWGGTVNSISCDGSAQYAAVSGHFLQASPSTGFDVWIVARQAAANSNKLVTTLGNASTAVMKNGALAGGDLQCTNSTSATISTNYNGLRRTYTCDIAGGGGTQTIYTTVDNSTQQTATGTTNNIGGDNPSGLCANQFGSALWNGSFTADAWFESKLSVGEASCMQSWASGSRGSQ